MSEEIRNHFWRSPLFVAVAALLALALRMNKVRICEIEARAL